MSTDTAISLWKAIRLVKHDLPWFITHDLLPMIYPASVFPITLSLMCLEMASVYNTFLSWSPESS